MVLAPKSSKKKPKIVLKPKYWNIEILRRKSLALKSYQEERWSKLFFQIEVFLNEITRTKRI